MLIAFASGFDVNLWQCVEDPADSLLGVGHADHCSTGHNVCPESCQNRAMSVDPPIRGVIPYVFCADAGAVADSCVDVLGFIERERWHDETGVVRNVELVVGDSEVWLDGPVPDWRDKSGGPGSWVGLLVDDVDAIHDRLVAAGVELDPPRTRDHSVKEITVTDPEGHGWGFVQRLR